MRRPAIASLHTFPNLKQNLCHCSPIPCFTISSNAVPCCSERCSLDELLSFDNWTSTLLTFTPVFCAQPARILVQWQHSEAVSNAHGVRGRTKVEMGQRKTRLARHCSEAEATNHQSTKRRHNDIVCLVPSRVVHLLLASSMNAAPASSLDRLSMMHLLVHR